MKLTKEKVLLTNKDGTFLGYKTQVTYGKRLEVCGLCGGLEVINELGEFVSPCPRKQKINAQSL